VNRTERQAEIATLREMFLKASNAYVVEFSGLKVEQVNDLRRKVRSASGRYRVIKNRLAQKAAEGTPLAGSEKLFDGPTAVAWTAADPVVLAKVLAEFQKSAPVKVKGIVLEGKALPAASLDGIVSLPSRPELISRFAGMLRSPLTKFVVLLKAPVRDFASALRQIADKKKPEIEEPNT